MTPAATTVVAGSPAPTSFTIKGESLSEIVQLPPHDLKTLVIVTDGPNDSILRTIADVTGKGWKTVGSLEEVGEEENNVVGITAEGVKDGLNARRKDTLVINTHCISDSTSPASALTDLCDYEFLYVESPFLRRDLTRFLSHILGQANFHEQLLKKERSNLISTTFPDVRTALSNLDILTVGADAVELRVDLLKETRQDGTFNDVPSLKYVGEQVMLLRQRSELPLIFTTRCVKENGKFPMDDPMLFYKYLFRAIQWGVEYIDVELWLPEEIRFKLKEKKGSSKIISAYHDFSGDLNWTSEEAFSLFAKAAQFADIVKMIKIIKTQDENHLLEIFRSQISSQYPHPPLSAVNMGQIGQWSRALNRIFSPITHPLLPTIAAPGQLSAAEINGALHFMGNLPKREFYAIGNLRSTSQAVFFEKCFNELGLPHSFASVYRGPKGSAEPFVAQSLFGGAYLQPPIASAQHYLPNLTDSARTIGQVDTIVNSGDGNQRVLIGDNTTWKGIRATLTRDFVPSAYFGRTALVLSQSPSEAAPAMFALRSLEIGTVYTVGFKAGGPLADRSEPFTSIESLKRVQQPFVIISALPPEKSLLVQPLLRHYGGQTKTLSRVFVDLSYGPRKGDPLAVAAAAGWSAYGFADVSAWTTVETLRLLVGHNAPFDFVRMASGRGIY
jgi:3-dehydroquinate dehydratase I